jgi:hypothetical protein
MPDYVPLFRRMKLFEDKLEQSRYGRPTGSGMSDD